jgi:hypothetical protein
MFIDGIYLVLGAVVGLVLLVIAGWLFTGLLLLVGRLTSGFYVDYSKQEDARRHRLGY